MWLVESCKGKTVVLEGSWEEIQQRCREFAGKRVRVQVTELEKADIPGDSLPAGTPLGALREVAGTWVGDDFEECLELVYKTRSQAIF